MKPTIHALKIRHIINEYPDTSWVIGIIAEAIVKYPEGNNGSYRLETLSSSGLWGIENNSGKYLDEVGEEQLAELKQHLECFNVDTSNFDSIEVETMEIVDTSNFDSIEVETMEIPDMRELIYLRHKLNEIKQRRK
jgi:hypothetical protein